MPQKASRGAKTNQVPFQMSTRHRLYAPETPISTDDQISNDSADEGRSDDTTMMEDMRAGLLRQLREEMAQQLREELRREMRTERPQSPVQQPQEDATYKRSTEIQQLDLVHREQERIRKLAKSKFGTQQPAILDGRNNYTIWRDSVLMDAHMIEAKGILDQTEPPEGDEIDIARWRTKNEILHTRILQSIAPHVRETISWEDSTLAAEIWARITSCYGLSTAEERLMTVKALLDINPQGNYPAMIRDVQRIMAKLKRMDLSFEDLMHDIFICSLGQWQQNFVRTKLDEFYSCGRGVMKNLDIATFADQLVARSSFSSNKYIPQNPQEFKLETKHRISPSEPPKDSRTKRDNQDQKQQRTKTLCQACGKGYHKPDDCWKLHPEKESDLYKVKPIACTTKLIQHEENNQKDHGNALPTATMQEWHQRLSHIHFRAILKLEQQKILKIKGKKTLAFCTICRQAKQKRKSSKDPAPRATKILARIHIDTAGGGATLDCKDDEAPPGIKNIRYFMLITDDATRYRWVYTLRTRDAAIPTFQGWLEHIKNQGFSPPAFVRSDREFITESVKRICQTYGLVWEPTTADSPWQDGVSERGIQTVLQRTRATLFDSDLPRWLWPQALQTAVNHMNRTTTRIPLYNDRRPMAPTSDPEVKPCSHITPYSAWTNGDADIKHLIKFGSPAWIHLHGASKSAGKPTSKLDPRSKKVHVVGYQGSHIYVVWDPENNQLRETSDISINEEFSPPQKKPYEAATTSHPARVRRVQRTLAYNH